MTANGRVILLLASLILLWFFTGAEEMRAQTKGGDKMTITITSSAFTNGGMIPKDYTCDGKNLSPPLGWTNVPEGAKTLAIVCDDPDAPAGTWVHWVLFDMPATVKELPQGIPPAKVLKNGAKHGINDFRKLGYSGPCPPGGTHRYYFKLYAIDRELAQEPGLAKADLLKAMKDHVLAEGLLVGGYKRQK